MKDNKNNEYSGLKVIAFAMSIGWVFNLIGVISAGHTDNKFVVGTIIVFGLWFATLFEK
ncbi:MAG: hypothetical protein ACOCP4_04610 [Candidatus Woesearchaeota archaeon]